jgi:hypothetical protein
VTQEVLNGGAPALTSEPANPAAAQPNAATTDAATGTAEGGERSQVTPKTYTEEEHREAIERATAKAAAKAERRAFREARAMLSQGQPQSQQASQPADDGKPARAQFASDEAYVDALTDWKLEQRDNRAKAERQQEQHRTMAEKTERIYAEAEKLPGFDRDTFDELPLTRPIVEALIDSDAPAKLMHYMAANPAEVERIAKLSPARQAAELGRLEASLPKTPRASKAPDPIGDPSARASTTTVPTDPSKMTHAQYREWRQKQGARWAN